MILTDPTPSAGRPLLFAPDMESVSDEESGIMAEILSTTRSILQAAIAEDGRAPRPVHSEGQGILRGELAVRDGLDPLLRQGVFAEPRVYPVLMRFSTNSGNGRRDGLCAQRGVALKIVGVDGERLPGSEGERTQDFVMGDRPAFSSADARAFLRTLKLHAAAAADRPEAFRQAASSALRGLETLIEEVGGLAAARTLPARPDTHVLASSFFTQVPLLFGPYVAKLRLEPVGPDLLSLKADGIPVRGRPNALREAMADYFESETAVFDLAAQLLTDRTAMPIEDASVVWPERLSPFRPLARITVPPQPVWDETRALGLEESLSFSPWHGLAAHRPLGSIMRLRRPAYEMSSSFRASRNGCPIHNPRREQDISIS